MKCAFVFALVALWYVAQGQKCVDPNLRLDKLNTLSKEQNAALYEQITTPYDPELKVTLHEQNKSLYGQNVILYNADLNATLHDADLGLVGKIRHIEDSSGSIEVLVDRDDLVWFTDEKRDINQNTIALHYGKMGQDSVEGAGCILTSAQDLGAKMGEYHLLFLLRAFENFTRFEPTAKPLRNFKGNLRLQILSKAVQLSQVAPTMEVLGAWQEDPFRDIITYDLEEGQSVNLTCEQESQHSDPIIEWELPTHVKNHTGRHRKFRQPYKKEGEFTVSHHEISRATLNDTGEYKCRAEIGGTPTETATIYINVVGRNEQILQMEFEQANITHYSKTVEWQILYRAHPKPVFQWYRGPDLLLDSSNLNLGDKRYEMNTAESSEGRLSLLIAEPEVTDIGEYTLRARVQADGKKALLKSVNMYFTMQAEPENIYLTASNKQLMHKNNSMFRLTCQASGYPKPEIQLEFRNCSAKGECSDFVRETLKTFNELKRHEADDPKEKVTHRVSWTGEAQVPGYYRCIANNTSGNDTTSEMEFLVTDGDYTKGPISIEVVKEEDVEGKVESHHTLIEGDNPTLRCRANKMRITTHPKWKMSRGDTDSDWNGEVTESETALSYLSEINIQGLTNDVQNFTLTCGDGTHSFSVFIRIKPKRVPEWKHGEQSPFQAHYQLEVSTNLNLTCSAVGDPTPVITWYKDGKQLKDVTGDRIIFDYLKTSHSGSYRCQAKNRVGSIEAHTKLDVHDPGDIKIIYILVVVGVLISVLIIIIIFFCRKIYQERKRELDLQLREQQMFNEGDPDSLNPQISLDQQAELLPYNAKYEVPRDSIIFEKLLGAGAFGRVYRATAINLLPGQPRTVVAVKMMKSRTDSAQLKALRSEVKIMIHIGRHINIVNLLGAHSKDLASKGELLLLVEYCKYGNILDYMRRHRREFINQINDEDKIDPSISDQRFRQRSGSGSRSRQSRGLKYAHLTFHQNSMVQYTPDQPQHNSWGILYDTYNQALHSQDSNNSEQTFMPAQDSPLPSPGIPEASRDLFRSRSISSSSHNQHITSDSSNMTFESSGGSDGYISSRSVGGHPQGLCSKDLLGWSYQVAKGMEYLAFKKVLHGDLACRNILLAENNIVKISDFGLAKDIYKNENYKKKSSGPMPVKWLALECLQDGVFSTQSDVWSFGVVMWEIFTLGKVPYAGIDYDENFVDKLAKGVRLEQPRFATYALYRLMLECWNGDPMDRPSFTHLETSLGEMLGEAERQHYLELNQPYEEDTEDASLLDRIQSPDYTAKVQNIGQNVDEDGYEMPFSPNPCCPPAPPLDEIVCGQNGTPRLTFLQRDYLQRNAGATGGDDGTYMPMSSPSRKSELVFNFDQDAVSYIAKRDSEVMQERSGSRMDGSEVPDSGVNGDLYLRMDSGTRSLTPSTPGQQGIPGGHPQGHQELNRASGVPHHAPSTPIVLENPPIALRKKLDRHPSDFGKHDSGIYSPSVLMQTNPSYMIMNGFVKTDESNYITKEDAQGLKNNTSPPYENFQPGKMAGSSIQRDYLKEGKSVEEYANLLPRDKIRDRTISEASSGIGSMNEESPPQSLGNFDTLKSSLKDKAIIEEPVTV